MPSKVWLNGKCQLGDKMKLSLDDTWKNCLSMWRWIAKEVKGNSPHSVDTLKAMWLTANGFADIRVYNNCFFCHYVSQTPSYDESIDCFPLCPGGKVAKDFDCFNKRYCWSKDPIKFYNKLVSLNKKRLKNRSKK